MRAEGGGGRFPPPGPRSYLRAHAIDVARIREPEWRESMRELLRARRWTRRHDVWHALDTTLEIAGHLIRHPGALARTVKRQLWDRPPGTPASVLLPRIGLSPGIRDDLRFGSSAEAIAHANARPRPRKPYSWETHRLRRSGAVARRHPTPHRVDGPPAAARFRPEAPWS